MKNKLLVALAFLGLGTPVIAQSSDSAETKNHLGIIASPSLDKLFESNRSLPVGLIYKRQVKENQAWRLTTTGQYNQYSEPLNHSGDLMHRRDHSDFSGKVALGYEWQQKLNNRFQFYYGADAGFGYQKNSENTEFEEYYDTWQNEYIIILNNRETSQRTLTYFLKPLVGLQFKISQKLYLATETSLNLQHSRHEMNYYHSRFFSDGSPDTYANDSYKSRVTSVWCQPLSNIQLVYKF
ncbi:hypothetical protein I5M27_17785 [Adhaeribacter sp. BT258]|uniref:DUF481 domain-containing protein n=1 Tax=Adhaeribacter terrigena TaxID=2793070 RepID=A0ABS1C643_9BACT|nr:hypothetical protein [Adhaeribacter terrigena]MBK0404847.1 hypothetical protein [Adhaeribacter terrigena]